MKKFQTIDEARDYFKDIAYDKLEKKINLIGLSSNHIKDLSIEQLRGKIGEIDSILDDRKKIKETGELNYFRDENFSIPKEIEPEFGGFHFNVAENLINKKREILELIKLKDRATKIESISGLVDNISEPELQQKFKSELEELQNQAQKFEAEEQKLDEDTLKIKSIQRELELSKSKIDLFDKKSQIWLRILGKESIASILGGVILLIMSISLLVAMFVDIETSNIIESAFLLILGYFFGQAVSKSN
jgi:hypothetical protein